MRKLLPLALSAGLLVDALSPQWRSFERMENGDSRLSAGPPKEILVGVCWPFSVNQDGMADGLELARGRNQCRRPGPWHPGSPRLRDDAFDPEKAKRIAIEFSGSPGMSAVLGYYDDKPSHQGFADVRSQPVAAPHGRRE